MKDLFPICACGKQMAWYERTHQWRGGALREIVALCPDHGESKEHPAKPMPLSFVEE